MKKLSEKEFNNLMEKWRKEGKSAFKSAKIVHNLVNQNNANYEAVELLKALKEMIGTKITDAGFVNGYGEGRIAFDFKKGGKEMRLVLGYNDLGEWVKYFGEK